MANNSTSSKQGKQRSMREQHAKAGQGKGNRQSGAGTGSRAGGVQGGVQGGTPEQHAEAGRQSHKNDGNKQSAGAGSRSGGSRGGNR